MDYYIILYFFAGILQDFLLTLNWRYIAKHKIAPAVGLSFSVTIVSMLVIYNIISRLDSQRSIFELGFEYAAILEKDLLTPEDKKFLRSKL